MMISIIAEDYGNDFAVAVSDMCLNSADISPRSAQRSSIAKAINSRNPRVLEILRAMYANLENPLTLEELADHAKFSRRQMERQFKLLFDETPSQIYRNIKLERARALLMETDLGVMQVAMASGFSSSGLFSRHFRERYGETPYGQRGRTKSKRGKG